jgi:hypothetical protein
MNKTELEAYKYLDWKQTAPRKSFYRYACNHNMEMGEFYAQVKSRAARIEKNPAFRPLLNLYRLIKESVGV